MHPCICGGLLCLLPQFIRDVSTLQFLRCHGGLSGSAGDLISETKRDATMVPLTKMIVSM